MHKLSREVLQQYSKEILPVMEEMELARRTDFANLLQHFGWEESANHTMLYGIPRYVICADNLMPVVKGALEMFCPVLPFHLFDENSVMFSWGRSETDNVLQLKINWKNESKDAVKEG